MQDHIQDWLSYIEGRLSPHTVRNYTRIINLYIQSIPHVSPSPNDVEKYLTRLRGDHKASTINRHLITIRSFYRWAEKSKLCDNPAKHVAFYKEEPPRARVLTEKEYQLVITFAHNPLNKALQFLGNTGLRECEFRRITWDSFSPGLQFVHVEGKGRKRRDVPLNDTCRRLLQPRNGTRPDFVTPYTHEHLIYLHCIRLAARLRIEPFGTHAVRHFFATRLINAGVPLTKVSMILGHASTLITEKTYCHLRSADLQVTDCLQF